VRWRGPVLFLFPAMLIAGLACGQRSVPAPTFVSLGGDVVRVGAVGIPGTLVSQVARSRGVPPREALDGLVEDALFAQAARAAKLDLEPAVRWGSAATFARLVLERLQSEARARGAPVEDELMTVTVVHAVVLRSPTLPRARALELAGAILQAASGARDDEDFEARAGRLPHPGALVNIERVDGFDASGHTARGDELEPSFVAAAFDLRLRGTTSEIVETRFGWHVIRLMDRVAPDPELLERRRTELAEAIFAMRFRTALRNALLAKRKRVPVEVAVAAGELMAKAAASTR
jgi:hypothetical protein